MPKTIEEAASGSALEILLTTLSLVLVVLAGAITTEAQSAAKLSQVKKLYIGSLGNGKAADAIRHRMANRLRATRAFELVGSADQADAAVTGDAAVWVTGHVSVSIRSPHANEQPIYDGFLSASLTGRDGVTLWSYLVTPSKSALKPITADLPDQIVKKLLEALAAKTGEEAGTNTGRPIAPVSLHGAGATLPWPIYQKWFESFHHKVDNISINYDPVGSEAGIKLITEGKLDFAGSDMPLSDEAMAKSHVKLVHFASVVGAVVPIYNLRTSGRYLNLTPEALAGIYLGSIKRWNDSAIKAHNPGIALPDREIIVIHRSDGSGTTFAWTDYLSRVSPQWKKRVGADTTVSWPVGTGAERNEGVAGLVRNTPYSIGYVELIYAIQHELSFGAVRNSSGKFIHASLSSATAAAAHADIRGPDVRISITNPAGKQSYPITTFTYLLFDPKHNEQKTSAMVEFLRWMLTSGQRQCAALGYAPLPGAIADRELQLIDTLK